MRLQFITELIKIKSFYKIIDISNKYSLFFIVNVKSLKKFIILPKLVFIPEENIFLNNISFSMHRLNFFFPFCIKLIFFFVNEYKHKNDWLCEKKLFQFVLPLT